MCEDLIADSSSLITRPLRAFLDRCTQYLSTPSGQDLPLQDWASSAAVTELHETFEKGLREQAGGVREKLKLYLNDEKTMAVLLPPLLVRRSTRT